MGERLAGGNVGIALLANTLATGAMLVTLILTFVPISGAHFNPAVALADASQGGLAWRDVPGYLAAELAGDCSGNHAVSLAGAIAAETCWGRGGFSSGRMEGKFMSDKKRVLILCTGNSARSQMAEGLLRHDAGERFEVESAGTKASFVRPEAIAVMGELGIDISGHRSKNVDEFDGQQFDYVITVCDNARETCPVFFGGAQKVHRDFEDPVAASGSEEERLTVFRRVRDQLRTYLRDLSNNTA
jgi:arsenate reductase